MWRLMEALYLVFFPGLLVATFLSEPPGDRWVEADPVPPMKDDDRCGSMTRRRSVRPA
jgi:hypothetical protein